MESLTPRARLLLALAGLALIVLSLLALGYAAGVPARLQEQFLPEPTWFAAPQSRRDGSQLAGIG